MPDVTPGDSAASAHNDEAFQDILKDLIVGAGQPPESRQLLKTQLPLPTEVVIQREVLVIDATPFDVRKPIPRRPSHVGQHYVNQQASYHNEGKGDSMSNAEGSSAGVKFAKLILVFTLSMIASILPLSYVMSAYKEMATIEAIQQKPQEGVTTSGKPHSVPLAQQAPSFPPVSSYPCTSGSPVERPLEGYDSPYRASGGFEVYVGCAWVTVPFATSNVQTWRNVRLEHPESGQVCMKAADCIQLLNRVWQQAGDKRVRVVVPPGGEFMHWG
jgi:hypothetical protein